MIQPFVAEKVVAGPFDLSGDAKLGITFQTAKTMHGVTVLEVKKGHLVTEWNSLRPMTQQIVPGVYIESWNGQTGRARNLSAAIKSREPDLRLTVLTGPRYNFAIRIALDRVFRTFDTDASGALSVEEFTHAARQVVESVGEDIDEASLKSRDNDGNGFLDVEEFFDYTISIFEEAGLPLEDLEAVLKGLALRQEARAQTPLPEDKSMAAEDFEAFINRMNLGDISLASCDEG